MTKNLKKKDAPIKKEKEEVKEEKEEPVNLDTISCIFQENSVKTKRTTIKLPEQEFIPDLMNQLLSIEEGKSNDKKDQELNYAYHYFTSYFIKTNKNDKVHYFYEYNPKEKNGYFVQRLNDSPPMFNNVSVEGKKNALAYFTSKWPTFTIIENYEIDDVLYKEEFEAIFYGKKRKITKYYFNQRPRIDQKYEKPWTEYSEEAQKGVKIFWFILNNIWLNGVSNEKNKKKYQYFLRNWILNVINLKRTGSCIYNQAKQGTGKSTITEFLLKVIGSRYSLNAGQGIFGRFNSQLRDKIFVSIEELHKVSIAEWGAINSQLKQMITNAKFTIEAKYMNAEEVPLYANFIINTNEKFLRIEEDDRRYFVSEILPITKEQIYKFGEEFGVKGLQDKKKKEDKLIIDFWIEVHKYLGVRPEEETDLKKEVRKCFYAWCVDTYNYFINNKNSKDKEIKKKVASYYEIRTDKPPKTDLFIKMLLRTPLFNYIYETYLMNGLGIEVYEKQYINASKISNIFSLITVKDFSELFKKYLMNVGDKEKYIKDKVGPEKIKKTFANEFKINEDTFKSKYITDNSKDKKPQAFTISFTDLFENYKSKNFLTSNEIDKIEQKRYDLMLDVRQFIKSLVDDDNKIKNKEEFIENEFNKLFPDNEKFQIYEERFSKQSIFTEISTSDFVNIGTQKTTKKDVKIKVEKNEDDEVEEDEVEEDEDEKNEDDEVEEEEVEEEEVEEDENEEDEDNNEEEDEDNNEEDEDKDDEKDKVVNEIDIDKILAVANKWDKNEKKQEKNKKESRKEKEHIQFTNTINYFDFMSNEKEVKKKPFNIKDEVEKAKNRFNGEIIDEKKDTNRHSFIKEIKLYSNQKEVRFYELTDNTYFWVNEKTQKRILLKPIDVNSLDRSASFKGFYKDSKNNYFFYHLGLYYAGYFNSRDEFEQSEWYKKYVILKKLYDNYEDTYAEDNSNNSNKKEDDF